MSIEPFVDSQSAIPKLFNVIASLVISLISGSIIFRDQINNYHNKAKYDLRTKCIDS